MAFLGFCFLFFTWLLLSRTVNINSVIIALVQSSSYPSPVSQSASMLYGLNLCSPAFQTLICGTHLLLISTSKTPQLEVQLCLSFHLHHPQHLDSGGPVLNPITDGFHFAVMDHHSLIAKYINSYISINNDHLFQVTSPYWTGHWSQRCHCFEWQMS